MNSSVSARQSQLAGVLPPQFQTLFFPPQLLPGESLNQYQTLQTLVFRDLAPRSSIEWLLAIDIAELSWEIQRYNVLRHRLLSTSRQKAIEATLHRIDVAVAPAELQRAAEFYSKRLAATLLRLA